MTTPWDHDDHVMWTFVVHKLPDGGFILGTLEAADMIELHGAVSWRRVAEDSSNAAHRVGDMLRTFDAQHEELKRRDAQDAEVVPTPVTLDDYGDPVLPARVVHAGRRWWAIVK